MNNIIQSELIKFPKRVENFTPERVPDRLVWYKDFVDLFIISVEDAVDNFSGIKYRCHYVDDEKEGECISFAKEDLRPEASGDYHSSIPVSLDETSALIMATALKTIKDLEKKSWVCTCA